MLPGSKPSILLRASVLLLGLATGLSAAAAAAAAAVDAAASPAAASAARLAAEGAVSSRNCVRSGKQVTEKVGTAPAGGPAFAAPAREGHNAHRDPATQ